MALGSTLSILQQCNEKFKLSTDYILIVIL